MTFGPVLVGQAQQWLTEHGYDEDRLRGLVALVAMGGPTSLSPEESMAALVALSLPAFLLGAVRLEVE